MRVEHRLALIVATLAIGTARADLTPGPCPPEDLLVILDTGWDENAEAVIAPGNPDDDWEVLSSASGTPPPPPEAPVRAPHPAWLTFPNSNWLATGPTGPNGSYVYETCWCMDDSFTNPLLTFAIRADDRADVYLNGFSLISLPDGTFNDPIALGMSVTNPSMFFVGLNCMTVIVEQLHGGPHGFDLTGSVTADDGRCCGCYELPPDAEAWWRLDETSGTTAADEVGGHHGTYAEFGGPTGLPPTPFSPGCVAGSLSFDGIDDYVDVPDAPGLDFDADDELTIDAWINTTNPLREPIVHKKNLSFNSPGYAFMVGGGVLTFEMADGTSTVTCNGGAGLDDAPGACRFVAVTLERGLSTGLTLYIDGVAVGTCDPTPVGDMTNALPLSIGAKPTAAVGAMWWRGQLDEIEIFRRALTPTEVLGIKLAGGAGKCPPEQPIPCEQSEFPACNGVCPPGQVCSSANGCFCEPLTECGAPGDYPMCEGPCPQGLVCEPLPGAPDCHCVQASPPCGDTHYPECNGTCPVNQKCVNVFGTDTCHCETPPQPCGDPLYPACNGTCPANQKCVARDAPVPGCECQTCAVLGGSGLGGVSVGWPASSKSELRWTGASECALVYNAYRSTGTRLLDDDRNGLADDYGSCYVGDIIGLDVSDPSAPPPGQVHWYLVTAENFDAEGSLGENSAGVERPNLAPCP